MNDNNISTDEHPSLRIESFTMVNLRRVSTKLYFNLIFTIQTYKEPNLQSGTCNNVATVKPSDEASSTLGQANANISVLIDHIRNQFPKK